MLNHKTKKWPERERSKLEDYIVTVVKIYEGDFGAYTYETINVTDMDQQAEMEDKP